MSPTLNRPAPVTLRDTQPVDRTTPVANAAVRLVAGEQLAVTDLYGTGVDIVSALSTVLPPPPHDAPYAVRRAARAAVSEAAARLVAPVRGHHLALANAPTIGFLAELYPELDAFPLSMPHVQQLAAAWHRYADGVQFPVLGHRLHPFWGTYTPTRMTHLELLATWLSQHRGPRTTAIDVGTGCGVLALMLAKAGVERVTATDSNPNAVLSVRREVERLPSKPSIQAVCTDLFGDVGPVDLIVFNPPWLPGPVDGPLEAALHFTPGLFERFFSEAAQRLTPEGRVVVVFSNLVELVRPDVEHPVRTELSRGRRFTQVQRLQRKVKASHGPGGRRRPTRERVEVWELRRV